MFTRNGTTELADRLNEMWRRQAREERIPVCFFDSGNWVIAGQAGWYEEADYGGFRAYSAGDGVLKHLRQIEPLLAADRRFEWETVLNIPF